VGSSAPGRQWWSIYDASGARIAELETTAEAIRDTLPGAVIREGSGVVEIAPARVQLAAVSGPVNWGESPPEIDTD